jgi:hypothetical protein
MQTETETRGKKPRRVTGSKTHRVTGVLFSTTTKWGGPAPGNFELSTKFLHFYVKST